MNQRSTPAADFSPLSASQLQALETTLLARQAQLDRQMAEHQGGASRVEHAAEVLALDGDDRQGDADREVELARADRELQELGQVSQALRRLKQPGYGLCEDCGEAIALGRLKLEPWALRCVACESRHEGPLKQARVSL